MGLYWSFLNTILLPSIYTLKNAKTDTLNPIFLYFFNAISHFSSQDALKTMQKEPTPQRYWLSCLGSVVLAALAQHLVHEHGGGHTHVERLYLSQYGQLGSHVGQLQQLGTDASLFGPQD